MAFRLRSKLKGRFKYQGETGDDDDVDDDDVVDVENV